jgi:hypothetical protein
MMAGSQALPKCKAFFIWELGPIRRRSVKDRAMADEGGITKKFTISFKYAQKPECQTDIQAFCLISLHERSSFSREPILHNLHISIGLFGNKTILSIPFSFVLFLARSINSLAYSQSIAMEQKLSNLGLPVGHYFITKVDCNASTDPSPTIKPDRSAHMGTASLIVINNIVQEVQSEEPKL